jgi:hypothetical protein
MFCLERGDGILYVVPMDEWSYVMSLEPSHPDCRWYIVLERGVYAISLYIQPAMSRIEVLRPVWTARDYLHRTGGGRKRLEHDVSKILITHASDPLV